jgi:hypothetical protein
MAFAGADGTGALLDTFVGAWPGAAGFPAFGTLSVSSATPILSVRFFGSGPFHNSLFWDNLSAVPTAAPEPLSLSLLGIAAAGYAGYRRRKA